MNKTKYSQSEKPFVPHVKIQNTYLHFKNLVFSKISKSQPQEECNF